MATSSDETMGEVTSKSVKISEALHIKPKTISKNKDFSPNLHRSHLRFHARLHEQMRRKQFAPLTENLSTWSCRRTLRCIRPLVVDYKNNLRKGPATVVELRQCDSAKRRIQGILFRLGEQRTVIVDKGLDFYFDSDRDAYTGFRMLCSRFPIRPAELSIPALGRSYITAMVCPIFREDLIYLRSSKALAALGSSGPLTVCTMVTNSISLLNPFTLAETTVSAVEYWNEPANFEIYKSVTDLVEYIVLDVRPISKGSLYWLADVDVARVADFGNKDIVFTTRTHLGYYLKPDDRALGYDLYGANNDSTMMGDESKESLPDVVLIKKKQAAGRVTRRNISPEYEEFLRDLENNPEAMFRLSLNGDNNNNKAEKQQSVIDSMIEGKISDSGLVLDRLLADLMLADTQDVGAAGTSDEQHR
ncbi:hypothetical protein vseg_005523 [Gypsophila vaccaria]